MPERFRKPLLNTLKSSPFKLVHEHTRKVVACASLLKELCQAYLAEDFEAVAPIAQQISELEHAADEVRHRILSHLPHTFMMPVSRSDLITFLKSSDKVANYTKNVATLSDYRHTHFPQTIKDQFTALTAKVVECVATLELASNHFHKALESTFFKPDVDQITKLSQHLSDLESHADKIEQDLVRGLFALEEEGVKSLAIIHGFWVVTSLARVADVAELAGLRLTTMVSR